MVTFYYLLEFCIEAHKAEPYGFFIELCSISLLQLKMLIKKSIEMRVYYIAGVISNNDHGRLPHSGMQTARNVTCTLCTMHISFLHNTCRKC